MRGLTSILRPGFSATHISFQGVFCLCLFFLAVICPNEMYHGDGRGLLGGVGLSPYFARCFLFGSLHGRNRISTTQFCFSVFYSNNVSRLYLKNYKMKWRSFLTKIARFRQNDSSILLLVELQRSCEYLKVGRAPERPASARSARHCSWLGAFYCNTSCNTTKNASMNWAAKHFLVTL